MRKLFTIAAAAALMPAMLHAASLTKGQICEERALKETYHAAMRYKCNGELTKECKRLTDEWLTAAALKKRRCIDESRMRPSSSAITQAEAALEYCARNPDARETGRDDESLLSVRECALRILQTTPDRH
jgi:hypothetical protein